MDLFINAILDFFKDSGLPGINVGTIIMVTVSLILMWLAIAKDYEPLLLVPISFGMLMVNLPLTYLMAPPAVNADGTHAVGGLLWYIYQGDELGIFPPLIFLGVGALTDFGPLIANPISIFLGAAAQLGVFVAFLGAIVLGFTPQEAASIGIIGGADGPTSIYLSTKLAPHLLGAIAVSAYSYMSLVPIIQPPIMRLCSSRANRAIVMDQLRPVSAREKIVFPIVSTIVASLLVPSAAALIGMLMLGNLFRECGVTPNLARTAGDAMMFITVICIGVTVGATASAEAFLNSQTLGILALGLIAFAFSTFGGMIFGNIMCALSGGKINPLIGSAGVSAVPMAARVSQKVGAEVDPFNFLLMHAMGPNVAGCIGTAVAAGVFLTIYK
ncbi:MAG: sodium ion-translocating decarboxylase subunit beta [Acidaminococcales bacterium]|jgi:oxaloacetate decarboxylase beta subunit|nr:sodium ion-translocating decarboxylase subunit beta [Acidaminococcales bacterium]